MTKKRNVILVKIRDKGAALLKRAKNVNKKTLLKLICETSLIIVVIAKMIILIMWEVNTLINE